jgi:putative PIN family toxin of toxin-antitoxin system
MRVVIDTNVWVSGLLWRGMPWRLLCLAEAGQVEICVAATALIELARVLSYEQLQPRIRELGLEATDIVAYATNLATVFDVPTGEPIVLADPDDDVFLRCAVGAGGAYVISGDHHLLDLGEHAGIPIVSVRDFLTREFPAANI